MSNRIRTAVILATGDELVQGRTVDTNSSYIADKLLAEGVEVRGFLTVGDDVRSLVHAWRTALSRADVVISTGGLGPTSDDLTTEVLADVAGVDTVLDEEQADRIRTIFAARRRPMPENNLKQALIPEGAVVLRNDVGTAPGYRLEIPDGDRRPVAVVMPGVPREMYAMLEEQMLPWLRTCGEPGRLTLAHSFQTFGLPESEVDQILAGAIPPEEGRLSFRASFPKIAVRVQVTAPEEEAPALLEKLAGRVRERLGTVIYAEGDASMEEEVGRLLKGSGLRVATAESCTGGLIGSRITDVAGSSDYYTGGLVAYSNDLKERLLGVSKETLKEFGAVSEETAREMALGVGKISGADLALATTGIAGPGGGTTDKPVGTVAVALAVRSKPEQGQTETGPTGTTGTGTATNSETEANWEVHSRIYRLWGKREWVKVLTSQIGLDWLRRQLLGVDPKTSDLQKQSRGRRGTASGAGVP